MTEQTLVILKPDATERKLVGEVIRRYEAAGLSIKTMKFQRVNQDLIKRHYPDSMARGLGEKSQAAGGAVDDVLAQGMRILGWNRDYLTRGPVVAIIFDGDNAVKLVRDVTGYTDPINADKGTIRGDLGNDSILSANRENRSVENLIHASGDLEEAEREIALWFPEGVEE